MSQNWDGKKVWILQIRDCQGCSSDLAEYWEIWTGEKVLGQHNVKTRWEGPLFPLTSSEMLDVNQSSSTSPGKGAAGT